MLSWVSGMGHSPWVLSTTLTDKFAAGTSSLIDAMMTEAGADLNLETPVAAIAQEDNRCLVTTRDERRYLAGVVVLATPMNTWSDITFTPELTGGKAAAAVERHSGHSVKPWVLARNVPEFFASWSWGGGLNWLSTEYELPEGSLMVGFAHSRELVDVQDPSDVTRAVKAVLPEADVVAVDGHDWNADEFAKGTWMAFRPGQLTRLHSELLSPHGRVIFAGSDVALSWPGWIEGAIESGASAAKRAAELLTGQAAA
jgi:monoamine oxidase